MEPDQAGGDNGRQVYLILLWESQPPSSAEQENVVEAKRAELGCPTRLLSSMQANPMPTEPDTFVIATALMTCKQAGIEFESERDTIAFSGGAGLGLITITVNSPS